MTFAYQILIHTPIWVFPLFAYLVWLGIKAMRPRTTTIWRSLIVPAIFIIWGLSRLLSGTQHAIVPLLSWTVPVMAPVSWADTAMGTIATVKNNIDRRKPFFIAVSSPRLAY